MKKRARAHPEGVRFFVGGRGGKKILREGPERSGSIFGGGDM